MKRSKNAERARGRHKDQPGGLVSENGFIDPFGERLEKGALAFIDTQRPVIENGAIKEWRPFTRFMLNQDTGGAIKGPGRVDLFWGPGDDAELSAGYMQQEGRLYFLIRKK